MEAVFLKLLNMSITASWLVLAVIVIRLLLKSAPKAITVFMWALVGIRLACPLSLESIFSLIPSAETIPANMISSDAPAIQSGIPVLNSTVNPIISNSLAPSAVDSVNPIHTITYAASVIWIVGILIMLIYTAISYLHIHRKVLEATPLKDNIWLCDHISTPFILGVIRPCIYLPSHMSEQDMEYVIAHEISHLKWHDHWWKPLGFMLLTVYWFNPVLWIAYILLCRDIELACDEKVIKAMGPESKKPYSNALINCSVPRRTIAACPLAFGEVSVKGRIKSVLKYKKPGFWTIIVAIVIFTMVAVGFLTNPVSNKSVNSKLAVFIDCEIASHHQSERSKDNFCCLDWQVLGKDKNGDETTIYMWVLYMEYSYDNGLKEESGAHIPTVITVRETNDNYELVEYWEPRDGSYYPEDIRDKFPWYLQREALDSQRYITKQSANCERMAREHFGISTSTTGGADGPTKVVVGKQLTLHDVIMLSEKGNKLKWEDFEDFSYDETGSGLYIRRYEIDDMFSLWIGGSSPKEEPLYFYLYASDALGEQIDIRTSDVQYFINEHKNNPIVKNVSAGWHCCPVGYNKYAYSKMIEAGGIPPKAILSSIQSLPVVKVTSKTELMNFANKMDGVMSFKESYSDTPSFSHVSKEYNEEYFKNTTLFLVYISAGSTSHRHTVEYVSKSLGVLSIGISEIVPESGDTAMEGWLIAIDAPKEQIEDIESIDARLSSTVYPDSGTANAQLIHSYVFTKSEETIKPSIALFDNGKFTFTFSAISSYFGHGEYNLEDEHLTLKTDDGRYIYVFDVVDDCLVFDADMSSKELWYSDIYDGAVFE